MTIAEVSKLHGVPADTLRYYERVGLLPEIQRTSGGIRNYTEDDCGWVDFIKCMRGAGVSVKVLIEYVTLFRQGPETAPARKQLLIEQRAQVAAHIEELTAVLARLDKKIQHYDDTILRCENQLIKHPSEP